MAVKKYSLKKDGNLKLSENFRVSEFRSRDGSDEILIDERLVVLLQKMRDKFGKINISSAYRTPKYNLQVGGVKNSQHVYGKACDITLTSSKKLLEAARYAEKIGFNGVGLDNRYEMFIHVDTRNTQSYFKYNSSGGTYSVPSFFTTVSLGSRGEEVKTLQTALKKLGFKDKNGEDLICDGVFGNNTFYALKNFQNKKSLIPDGIAGPKTWRKI